MIDENGLFSTQRAALALTVVATMSVGGCGGGGGGGDAFYAGNWDFTGVKLIDDCRSGLPSLSSAQHIVNQDGAAVVLNSARLTFSGAVHDEDGFQVDFQEINARNCESGSRIRYKNASDGSAEVAWAFVVRCGGLVCTVGYGGEARRSGTKAAVENIEELQGLNADDLVQTLEQQVASGQGILASLDEALDIAEQELVANPRQPE